jgi:signal transduction histidine kinase/CheY-like chemotaxis protein
VIIGNKHWIMLLSWLLLLPSLGNAQPQVSISRELSGQSLMPYASYWLAYPDRERNSLPFNANWQPVQATTANFGTYHDPVWIRLQLHAEQPLSDWQLIIDNPVLDQVDVYLLRQQQTLQHWHLGDLQAFAQRPVASHWFQLPLRLSRPGPYEVYIRVQTQGALQLSAALWHENDLQEEQANTYLLTGAYAGFIVAILLYNLFIYIANRERYTLYYIGFIASYLLFYLAIEGFGFQFLWPNSVWWQQRATLVGMAAGALFSCLFANHFLGLKRHYHRSLYRLNQIAKYGSWLALIATVALPFALALQLTMIAVVMIALSAAVNGIRASLDKRRSAIMYSAGWLLLFFGVIVHIVARQGWLPMYSWVANASHLGSILLVIVHGVAIAMRFHQQRREYLATQKRLLQSQREALRTRFQAQEAEIKRHQSEAEQQAQSQFLAMMSHEIRTPLNGVLGMTELLQDTPLNTEQQRLTDTISRSGSSLMITLNDILDISKIRSGKLEINKESTNLEALISDCLMLYQHSAAEKGLTLTGRFELPLWQYCHTDSARLRQIVSNLVSNAVKFTHQGHIEVRVSYPHGGLQIDVEDSGIGIDPSYQSQLFDHFSQADRSTSRHYGGSGLGLSICQQLAQLLGGNITVRSQPNQGSCFTLKLANVEATDAFDGSGLAGTAVALELPHQHPLKALCEHAISCGSLTPSEKAELRIAGAGAGLRIFAQQSIALTPPITTLQLLRACQQAQQAAPSAIIEPASPQPQQQQCIWVAEDNAVNQTVVAGMLRHLGYPYRLFDNGQKLLDALTEASKPALILMDCEMPELDGFDATLAIRQHHPTLPIIALSAHALPEFRQRAYQSGMNDFVTKPIKRQQLADALAQWLR